MNAEMNAAVEDDGTGSGSNPFSICAQGTDHGVTPHAVSQCARTFPVLICEATDELVRYRPRDGGFQRSLSADETRFALRYSRRQYLDRNHLTRSRANTSRNRIAMK